MTATTTPLAPTRQPSSSIPRWVRIGLLAMAVPNMMGGLWAVIAPQSWFDSFPGFGTPVVAAEPPFNAHLATDAGAGLLASGLVLLLAAWFAERRATQLALVAFATFAIPHTAYHLLNPAPGLTGAEDVQSTGVLMFTVVAAIVLLVGANRAPAANAGS